MSGHYNSFNDKVPVNFSYGYHDLQIDGLMQKRRNSIADALELCFFCIKASKWTAVTWLNSLWPSDTRDQGQHWLR